MQSVILLDTTSGQLNVTGFPQKGAGYNNSIGNNHTVSFSINNFVGRIYIEGSLEYKPSDADWVPIPLYNSLPYVQHPLDPLRLIGSTPGNNAVGDTGNFVYNFTGNFIWIRARIDRTYLIPPPTTWTQVGAVIKILLNYGAVSPAGTNITSSNNSGLQGPPGPQGPTGPVGMVTGPTGSQGLQGSPGLPGNDSIVTGPTGPSILLGGSTGAVQYNNGEILQGNNNFVFDPGNTSLSIGTNDTTQFTLNVVGSLPTMFSTLNGSEYHIAVGMDMNNSAILGYSPGANYGFTKAGVSGPQKLRWNTSGVGINGIVPLNALDVNGGIVIGNSLDWAGVKTAPSYGIAVQGRVGIGTSTPTQALDIRGNVNISPIGANATVVYMTGLPVADNDAQADLAGVDFNQVYRDTSGVLRIRIS